MSTKTGRQAEQAVCNWLLRQSFKIVATNWRTRYCEIDIVASKSGVVYFVEVKYRSKVGQGGGMDYITSKKLQQMSYAAELFMVKYQLDNQYITCAVSVGPLFDVEEFVELTI